MAYLTTASLRRKRCASTCLKLYQTLILLTKLMVKGASKPSLKNLPVIILNNSCIVEFDVNYYEILHNNKQDQFIDEISTFIMSFKKRQKHQPTEINLIVRESGSLANI